MSETIDSKVVEMKFDNKQFESNVQTTLSTLDKLKQSLKLTEATKGLQNISNEAKNVDMSGIASAVDTLKVRFSALQVMGVTALANITNSAVNAGKRMIAALTIEPIKTGFQEYETQINAVQTILANTQSKGTTLEQVNKALDELNHYADLTIYNFTEMARNIGTFTAAGVDLDTSVSAIKGIANLAAVSGSTSQQASTAMYQLSQALASGTVKLQDWNSVVNAGMGGQVFQDALKETARVHKINIDQMIKDEGSFRETLKDGWLTSSILTETLSKFTGDLNAEQLKSIGYTDKQVEEILKLGKTANEAATKVKTFTQLWDTIKEAAQSGWTQSWEIIVGDFEEAKALLTNVSDTIGEMLNNSANSRNELLQGWKDLGGRNDLINSFWNTWNGALSIISPIKEAFREIFPETTAEQLHGFTEGLKEFTSKLKLSEGAAEKLNTTFRGVFSILDIGKQALTSVLNPLMNFISGNSISSFGDGVLTATSKFGEFFIKLDDGIKTGKGFSVVSETLSKAFTTISNTITKTKEHFSGFGDVFSNVLDMFSKAAEKVRTTISKAFQWVRDNISAGDIFAGLAGGGIFVLAKKLSGLIDGLESFVERLKNLFDKKDAITTKFSDVLESLKSSLTSFTQGIKISSLVGIAVAVTLLSSSLEKISNIRPDKIAYSLTAIGIMIAALNGGFKSLCKSLSSFESKGTITAGIAMIAMSTAINILTTALSKMKDLSWNDIAKGLTAISVSIIALTTSIKFISKSNVTVKTSLALIILAESCKILSNALSNFSSLSWDEIGRGLTAMGGALAELTVSVSLLSKFGSGKALTSSLGIVIISKSLTEIADALLKFGNMSWDEIGRGLTAMGGALTELSLVCGVLGKLTGISGLAGALSILIIVQSLEPLADALIQFGSMQWNEIGRGLTAMGGALLELGVVCGVLGYLTNIAGIAGAITLLIAVQSLEPLADSLIKFGNMSWDEIGRGLTAMGGALLELGAVSGILGKLTGLSGLIGAGTILLAVQSLEPLAESLINFSSLSWDEIGRGLTVMGGALAEISLASGLTGSLTGLAGLVGAGTILLAVQGLDQLADSLIKFGSMSWEEIGRGLTAMGGALAETAIGGLLNTLSGLGSLSIATIAEPLGILADSIIKFADIEWIDLSNGLKAMGSAMGETAIGGLLNTFSGLGSSSIAIVAEPLGILADSVKKWIDVEVPENLSENLGNLANAITKFTFSDLGANAISSAAPGVGIMADSIKKWSDVTIPENLESNLTGIANGVKAFSFAFAGGWSIESVAEPLGTLVESVNKWSDVKIPDNLNDNLTNLSDGIKSFSWTFMGGWSINAVDEPLGILADSVKKWSNITVSSNIKADLTSISDGLKEFSSIDTVKVKSVAEPFNDLSEAFQNFSITSASSENLILIAQNIKKFYSELEGFNGSKLSPVMSSINDMMSDLSNTISSAKSSISNSMKNAMSGVEDSIASKTEAIVNSATTLVTKFESTITGKKSLVDSAFRNLVFDAADNIKSKYEEFQSAGRYLGEGLVSGINSKQTSAYNAGYALGQKSAKGVKDGAKEHSPSKLTILYGEYLGEGLIIGMQRTAKAVYCSGYDLGETATTTISNAITRISDYMNGDLHTEPTIRPVVDLSNIQTGIKTIDDMFGSTSISLMSTVGGIQQMMRNRQSNYDNSDVVDAISNLRKSIENNPRSVTTIGDISYSDNENINSAINTLVNAIEVERRA